MAVYLPRELGVRLAAYVARLAAIGRTQKLIIEQVDAVRGALPPEEVQIYLCRPMLRWDYAQRRVNIGKIGGAQDIQISEVAAFGEERIERAQD
jgi:hypothetical protein